MEIYLIRHAEAEEATTPGSAGDMARVLTPRGSEAFSWLVTGHRATLPSPSLVLSSPFLRAQQTCDVLRRAADWPAPTVMDALAPGGQVADVVRRIKDLADRASIALVGHNPLFSRLHAWFLTGNERTTIAGLRPGTIVKYAYDVAHGPPAELLWFGAP